MSKKASQWLKDNWDSLKPGQWVAASPSGIVSENADCNKLYEDLKTQSLPMDEIAIVYVPDGVVQ